MSAKTVTPPDRVRGFTSLAGHEAAGVEGSIRISDIDGYTLRRIWRDGAWWHSVSDAVGALSESADGRKYWNKLKQRVMEEGANEPVSNCHQLKLPSADGKSYKADCATTETLFRIIEPVPSKRAEPIKRYLAMAGAERILDTAQPARLIDRAVDNYRAKGRGDEWIDDRPQNNSARNELTGEWAKRGAEGAKAAPTTVAMSKEMLGVTPAEHRGLKGIGKSQELRDQFDNLELAVTTLGERAAKAIVVARDTKDFETTKTASIAGAKVAGDAARTIEAEVGRRIANSSNFLAKPDRTRSLDVPAAAKSKPATRKK